MHVEEYGPENAPRVLLLHGGGVAGWMWTSLRRRLEPTHRVLVVDLPGHGRSSAEPYRSHADTLEALVATLSRDGRSPVSIVGFSLGAQLALLLAARHPDLVERVAVVSAQARPMPFTDATLWTVGATAGLARRRWFARLQARELFIPPELLDDYLATSASISRQTLLAAVGANLRFTPPESWSSFAGPALILAGARERALMRESAAAIHQANPRAELEIVEGCGHGIPLQRPDWFDARISRWLGEDIGADQGDG